MAHRIRAAMKEEPMASMLEGDVEVDETYVGGKSRKGIGGRGSERKTAVMVLVERDGKAKAKPVERLTADSLQGEIRDNVDRSARILTDESASYKGIGENYDGGHAVIRHGAGEYVADDVHTNTAASFFALLKRGIHGAFHHVSDKHLPLYCEEFSSRWGLRGATDGARTEAAICGAAGKRLTYTAPVGA